MSYTAIPNKHSKLRVTYGKREAARFKKDAPLKTTDFQQSHRKDTEGRINEAELWRNKPTPEVARLSHSKVSPSRKDFSKDVSNPSVFDVPLSDEETVKTPRHTLTNISRKKRKVDEQRPPLTGFTELASRNERKYYSGSHKLDVDFPLERTTASSHSTTQDARPSGKAEHPYVATAKASETIFSKRQEQILAGPVVTNGYPTIEDSQSHRLKSGQSSAYASVGNKSSASSLASVAHVQTLLSLDSHKFRRQSNMGAYSSTETSCEPLRIAGEGEDHWKTSTPKRRRLKDKMAGLEAPIEENDRHSASRNCISNLSSSSPTKSLSPETYRGDFAKLENSKLVSLPSVGHFQLRQPKTTYTAKSRTVLMDHDLDSVKGFSVKDDLDIQKPSRQIQAMTVQPQATGRSDTFEIPVSTGESIGNSIRSIHELREAGSSARMKSELETLFDDLDTSSKFRKWKALLTLNLKIQDPTALQQIPNCNLEQKLLNLASSKRDQDTCVLLAIFLFQVVTTATSSIDLRQLCSLHIVTLITSLLGQNDSLLTRLHDRMSNKNSTDRSDFEKLGLGLARSSGWTYGCPPKLTPRSIALQYLENFLRLVRPKGLAESTFTPSCLEPIVGILSGSTLEGLEEPSSRVDLILSLSILELYLSPPAMSNTALTSRLPYGAIRGLCFFLRNLSTSRDSAQKMTQIWTLTLKNFLILTNNDPDTGREVSNVSTIKSLFALIEISFELLNRQETSTIETQILDNLVLSLGLLINIAEKGQETRRLFVQPVTGQVSMLDMLFPYFTSRLERAFEVTSEQESQLNVPFGYLAVLLVYLSIDSPLREKITAGLGGIMPLLEAATEFLKVFSRVSGQTTNSNEDLRGRSTFLTKVRLTVDEVRQGTTQ